MAQQTSDTNSSDRIRSVSDSNDVQAEDESINVDMIPTMVFTSSRSAKHKTKQRLSQPKSAETLNKQFADCNLGTRPKVQTNQKLKSESSNQPKTKPEQHDPRIDHKKRTYLISKTGTNYTNSTRRRVASFSDKKSSEKEKMKIDMQSEHKNETDEISKASNNNRHSAKRRVSSDLDKRSEERNEMTHSSRFEHKNETDELSKTSKSNRLDSTRRRVASASDKNCGETKVLRNNSPLGHKNKTYRISKTVDNARKDSARRRVSSESDKKCGDTEGLRENSLFEHNNETDQLPNSDNNTRSCALSDSEKKGEGTREVKSENNRHPKEQNNSPKRKYSDRKNGKPNSGSFAFKDKEFLLVVTLSDVKSENNLKEFLLYRMGNPKDLDFEVTKTESLDTERKEILIVLSFKGSRKRILGRSLLNKSNRTSEVKVRCFDNESDAKGHINDRTNDKRRALEDIIKTAEEAFKAHDDKLERVETELEHIEQKLHTKKGVSLADFQNLIDQKPALEDKQAELKQQRGEYVKYIQGMKAKIGALPDKGFDKQLRDIRVAFGAECRRFEAALPMYGRREDILTTIKENQVSVVLGETGSGKSTQMVQYLYQAGFANDGQIVCTQPRKIAAVSLAQRVASEMGSSVGQEVGYRVGMQTKISARTKIAFVTDHILLNECLKDDNLSQYQCIIIDEAHERSIFTDLLLGMLKKCLPKRPELRVVITSATIDPSVFTRYFSSECICPVLKVSGKIFPVDVFYEEDDFDAPFPENYESKALNKAIEIHRDTSVENGDILVFLTAPIETERCCEKFKQRVTTTDYNCLQLHGRLTPEEQHFVFEGNTKGKRKIVFATNSAETSITIPGIRYVVDSGVAKEMQYDPQKNINSLCVVPISQSSANQRKGRAGRVSIGTCYRLYKERDFNKMGRIGKPELLRIHLGQGLLKLMEIGVNPLQFDFVESPSPAAITSAIETLEEIKAVQDGEITELGRWISKIPVDPRLGALIKQGIDGDVALETLVIAAYNNQKNIFFRAGSGEDKKKSDMLKVEFCHEMGDIFTALNVYKAWTEVKEKDKGKWCKNKSVNGKAMKNIREMVKEVLTIIQKEANVKIKYEFSSAKNKDEVLQFLIFQNMISNLCVYLGHEKAGYLTLRKRQHVQLHPGSCLLPLGLQPTWAVFGQLLRTSGDFITDVTPVTDMMLEVAERNHLLSIDKNSFLALQVNEVMNVPVGTHVFRNFVGPMHSKRREIEENVSYVCNNTTIIIDANKVRGEISLYCLPKYAEIAKDTVKVNIDSLSTKLWFSNIEEPLSSNRNIKLTRVLIGRGGEVQGILMPSEYVTANVKVKDFCRHDVTEDSLRAILSQYGLIQRVWQAMGKRKHSYPFWGTVTFAEKLAAEAAVEDLRYDEDSDFKLIPITFETEKTKPQDFTLKLRWCRRPARNHCFVTLNNPEDTSRFLMVGSIDIDRTYTATISLSKHGSDLFIRGLRPDVTEDAVRNGLLEVYGRFDQSTKNRIGKIVIPRENVPLALMHTTVAREMILSRIEECTDNAAVVIEMSEVKEKTVMCTAFVRFTDPTACQMVADNMANDPFYIHGNKVITDAEFKSSVFIHKRVFKMIEPDIKEFEQNRIQRNSSKVHIRELKSGNFTIDIKASSPNDVARLKAGIDSIVEGDVLECGDTPNLEKIFSYNGRAEMQRIERSSDVSITVDERTMRLIVQGLKGNRNKAILGIKDFLARIGEAKEIVIQLKGPSNPPGLMKALLSKYGVGLNSLVGECNLVSAKINLRLHEVTLCGFAENTTKAVEKIDEAKQVILEQKGDVIDDGAPDCPVCLCPVEWHEMCRVEFCGHAYCNVCLTSQIINAIQSKEFPVKCAHEDCGKPLVIRDFTEQMKQGLVKKRKFIEATVADFVNKNNDKYRYCPTPDCNMLYPVSKQVEVFVCPQCSKKVCTKCHKGAHDGITCEMLASAARDGGSLLKWLKEKPDKRRLCPKCNVGIEKAGGCQHMNCRCGVHICWVCMKFFNSSPECYGHLESAHGSFM